MNRGNTAQWGQAGKVGILSLVTLCLLPVLVGGLWPQPRTAPTGETTRDYRALVGRADRAVEAIHRTTWKRADVLDMSRFAPPDPPAPPEPEPEPVPLTPAFASILQGIVWREGRPHAVVDQTVVTRGQVIHGFTILDIEPDRVVFRGPDGNVHLLDIDEQLSRQYPSYHRP